MSRLAELITFLETLEESQFDVSVIAMGDPVNRACLMGWFPAVWPDVFTWKSIPNYNNVKLVCDGQKYIGIHDAQQWLGICDVMLFYKNRSLVDMINLLKEYI